MNAVVTTAYVVIASELDNHAAAVKVAKRLSSRARLPLSATLRNPPQQLNLVGKVVSLHKPKPGHFLVTAFLGAKKSTAQELLQSIRQHAPTARLARRSVTNFDQLPTYHAYLLLPVVILASVKRCTEAMRAARRIARKTGVTFSARGLICDKKRGLIWPDNISDDLAGSYFGRRYNDCGTRKLTECISVERADFYGFHAGYHIVVGGIGAGDKLLARYRKAVPSAYAKDATIYLGCIH